MIELPIWFYILIMSFGAFGFMMISFIIVTIISDLIHKRKDKSE